MFVARDPIERVIEKIRAEARKDEECNSLGKNRCAYASYVNLGALVYVARLGSDAQVVLRELREP